MCSRTRTKKIIVGLALVVLPVACAYAYNDYLDRHYITYVMFDVLHFAFYVVVPVTVLIINVLLVREVRRASINAAANLGLHHQSTSSNSAVPTVMVVATSLVHVGYCSWERRPFCGWHPSGLIAIPCISALSSLTLCRILRTRITSTST